MEFFNKGINMNKIPKVYCQACFDFQPATIFKKFFLSENTYKIYCESCVKKQKKVIKVMDFSKEELEQISV